MRIVMMGTGGFAEPTFSALFGGPHAVVGLVTQPDRVVGQQRGSTRQTGPGMKSIAEAHRVPVFQPERINTPEGIEGLRAMQPELLVVAAYGQILSRDVLAVPALGGINVHASLLPKYRGAAPIAWAIYHGETESGVTIIRMSTQLDAGDMLAQEAVTIGPEETAGELELRLSALGAAMASRTLEQLEAGTTHGLVQEKSQVTKAPKLTKENGLIDWSRDARQVFNQIRAMQPWPTPFSYLHRANQAALRLIVWRARPVDGTTTAAPGDAVPRADDSNRLFVATGGGTVLELLELQPEGKRRMNAAEFLRGRPLQVGDRFGPPPVETP